MGASVADFQEQIGNISSVVDSRRIFGSRVYVVKTIFFLMISTTSSTELTHHDVSPITRTSSILPRSASDPQVSLSSALFAIRSNVVGEQRPSLPGNWRRSSLREL